MACELRLVFTFVKGRGGREGEEEATASGHKSELSGLLQEKAASPGARKEELGG